MGNKSSVLVSAIVKTDTVHIIVFCRSYNQTQPFIAINAQKLSIDLLNLN